MDINQATPKPFVPLPYHALLVEEAFPDTPNKRKSEHLLGHDLLYPSPKNTKSQETASFVEEGENSNGICRLDLLPEALIQKPQPVEEEGEESRNMNLQPTEGKGGGGGVDLISSLPDDALFNIISKLDTKEGAKTQILSQKWKPLWRLSSLNLQVDDGLAAEERKRISIVNKILSTHRGDGRRLYLRNTRIHNLCEQCNKWLGDRALNNLKELDFQYRFAQSGKEQPLLPPSALRFSSTLGILSLGNCRFPVDGNYCLHFPELKQFSLHGVTISESALQGLLSGCTALESLLILDCVGFHQICLRSPSIRSIGVRARFCTRLKPEIILQELVIMDAPCLERLLAYPPQGPAIIRVTRAPKLQVLGCLSHAISKLEIGGMILKEMIPTVLNASICTIKVLVLLSTGRNLGAVLNLLQCFPCLETLYVTLSVPRVNVADTQQQLYPPGPIHCLGHHLNKITIRGYQGSREDIDFANFFIVNARVLQIMKFGVPKKFSNKWAANQRKALLLNQKASGDAEFHFIYYYLLIEMDCQRRTHDLTMSDPFDA